MIRTYFYPRSPCGERPSVARVATTVDTISIHALLAESDSIALLIQPIRRLDFYPRSPCGERPAQKNLKCLCLLISIHALLAESDRTNLDKFHKDLTFLSTLSLRRATLAVSAVLQLIPLISIHALLAESDLALDQYLNEQEIISIHALLAESDQAGLRRLSPKLYFYPRSPCGERPHSRLFAWITQNFYPRSPCGERHLTKYHFTLLFYISIHALLAESDRSKKSDHLQPTRISIHALLAESDSLKGFKEYMK